jgi:hypothetical protein
LFNAAKTHENGSSRAAEIKMAPGCGGADVLRNGEDVRHGAILDDAEPLVAAELAMTDNQVADFEFEVCRVGADVTISPDHSWPMMGG